MLGAEDRLENGEQGGIQPFSSTQETVHRAGSLRNSSSRLVEPVRKQVTDMSGINGDKARFNRRRRQKISRRISNQKMLKTLAEKNLVPAGSQADQKDKTA